MTTHISTLAIVPHAGLFSVAEIPADHAGKLIAEAIDARTAQLHITQRNAADVIEQISDRRIGSEYLRGAEQREIVFAVGDVMVCGKMNAKGKAKVKVARGAPLMASDFRWLTITRQA